MKKVLFIDRDGTLIEEPSDFHVDSFDKLRFLSGAIGWLGKIASELEYDLVMVTNQDGLGTASFPEEKFMPVHDLIIRTLKSEGVEFADVFIDRTFEEDKAPTRKPGTGMLTKYIGGEYDLAKSFTIGDRPTDVELARNLGCRAIFIRNENFAPPVADETLAVTADSWKEIYDFLKSSARISYRHRKTSETDVTVELTLDGSGNADIETGLSFFDHMLEQVAKHGALDLRIRARGDLHIDEHHTIEDVAIVLGEAFGEALGDKRGIARYGFVLPMDDCLAQVAVDFGGRNWIVWDAEFRREKIGEMPTEMFFHFFKSFSDAARCNLNIKAEGTNEHHKIESIFKAFARSIRMAVRQEGDSQNLPSTKGSL